MDGMCRDQNARFSMAGMCRGQNVRFSIARMCCGKKRQIQHVLNVLWSRMTDSSCMGPVQANLLKKKKISGS
jgi:hypothetical protein